LNEGKFTVNDLFIPRKIELRIYHFHKQAQLAKFPLENSCETNLLCQVKEIFLKSYCDLRTKWTPEITMHLLHSSQLDQTWQNQMFQLLRYAYLKNWTQRGSKLFAILMFNWEKMPRRNEFQSIKETVFLKLWKTSWLQKSLT